MQQPSLEQQALRLEPPRPERHGPLHLVPHAVCLSELPHGKRRVQPEDQLSAAIPHLDRRPHGCEEVIGGAPEVAQVELR